ncbi:methylated-DNA--[protein]-cysteine S-methyltransferase [Stenotrophomonas sp. Ker107b]
MTLLYDTFDSPIGALTVAGDSQGIHHILFENNRYDAKGRDHWKRDAHALRGARGQLLEYLRGERVRFDLPLAPHGTPFQLRVWKALADIPFGQTWSYVELARHIDHPTASRAVGAANGRNPLPIVLPCHRVIGSSGALTGFGGGLETKAALLQLEARRDSLFA